MENGQFWATLIITGVVFSLPVLWGLYSAFRAPRNEEMEFDPWSDWEKDQAKRRWF